MKRVDKSVFISYRRSDGAWALSVYNWLSQHSHDVFIDFSSLGSGSYATEIEEHIWSRAHFLIVLTPTALDRCDEKGDWLRHEIETAMAARRNIVPLFFGGFRFDDLAVQAKLTGHLSQLCHYNGLELSFAAFEFGMQQLVTKHLAVHLEAVNHPRSLQAIEQVELKLVAANAARDKLSRGCIRIAIVDDHAIVRAGLRQFFSDIKDLVVVAEGSTGREAIQIALSGQLDVLILDLNMPGQGGAEALAAIRADAPNLPVLVMSGYPEDQYATGILHQGASGFISKECDPEELLVAIRTVSKGLRYISPTVGVRLLESSGIGSEDPHERLSERENRVLLGLAKGGSVEHIAQELNLSIKTVTTYRKRMLEKLELKTDSDLTHYALKHGLIE